MIAPEFAQAAWRKNTYSSDQANCVEASFADWHKSSRSTGEANCVEVAVAPPVVGVRDTKDRSGGTLPSEPSPGTHSSPSKM